jgi:hypothetical protein
MGHHKILNFRKISISRFYSSANIIVSIISVNMAPIFVADFDFISKGKKKKVADFGFILSS